MTDTALEALSTEDERLREPVAWQRRCLFPDKHTKEKPQWQDCLAMEVKSWPQHDYQYRPLYADPLPLTDLEAENARLRKALEEIAAPAIFFLSRKDAIRMRDIARDALKEGGE